MLMLISCPECNRNVSDKAVSCPECGYPINYTFKFVKTIENFNAPQRKRAPKRHRKLPNGFGSIKKLSGKRSNPYAAYPPVTEFNSNGSPVSVPAIGYFKDYYSAFDALAEYNKNPYDLSNNSITFAELYEMYYKNKYESNRKFSKASMNSTKVAFKNSAVLHDKVFKDIRKVDLQSVIDNCPLKHSSLELIVCLFKGMYKFARENDIITKDYSEFVTINIPDDESGEPFTQEELNLLWENKDKPFVDTILILIYSGFRISAFKNMEINLAERYFRGGIKTKAGKNRFAPIHDSIFKMVEKYNGDTFLTVSTLTYRNSFYATLESLGIATTVSGKRHTPHDCRHTFSWLCDKYGVNDFSKHLLMDHSLGGDVERSIYGHRTEEELREEMNKIKV